ncbi:unnamed protein product, partial [Cylicocyclus nassatus]
MRLLLLQLALCAVYTVAATVSNKLLEDYERKLNSINDKLQWRRNPGKHRLKRYRCIEEYVDEYGNVIEEGKEHFTTPAPVREFTMPRRRTKFPRMHGVKNTGADVTEKGPMKALKVTLVKKKRKKIDGGSAVYSTVAGLQSRTYSYVTVPLTTTTVIPTTEIIEDDDSADAT